MAVRSSSLDIIDETYRVLENKYGSQTALNFVELIRKTYGGNDLNLEGLPHTQQIDAINSFWRRVLSSVPNSTDTRSWLNTGNDIDTYINAFDNNWAELVYNSGLLA